MDVIFNVVLLKIIFISVFSFQHFLNKDTDFKNEVSNYFKQTLENQRFISMNENSKTKQSSYLYIPSFSEQKSKCNSSACTHSTRSQAPNCNYRKQKQINTSSPLQPKFLTETPKSFIIHEEGADDWTLRCLCQTNTTTGLLVGCEKCGCWQHAICVGLNGHTIPDRYLCEICGNRPIRCKCGRNSIYSLSLIRCSHCGYYVHRRCYGFLSGPLPPGEFICNYCGKPKLRFPKIKLSSNFKLDNDIYYTFTQEKIDNLPNCISNGPFSDFLSIEIGESTLNYREFFESFYDRFRPFFFICHPLNNNTISKKKRHNLFISFLSATKYLSNYFYNIQPEETIGIFDDLLFNDIFKTNVDTDLSEEIDCTFTEYTSLELERIDDIMKLPSMPETQQIEVRENGVFSCSNLKSGQFLMLAEGFIGDLEEFNYDDGVDYRFYQISGTKFILDSTHIKNSILHKMRRSVTGNCTLKLFKVNNITYCGIFINNAGLDQLFPNDICIKPGDELKLGIDFIPGVLEDITKWIGWHYADIENHTDSKSSELQTIPFEGKKSKSPKTKKKEQLITKKRGRKMKKGNEQQTLNTDFSLFDLFDSEGPCSYMFTVTDDVEKYNQMLKEEQQQKQNEITKKVKVETKHRQTILNKQEIVKPKSVEKKAQIHEQYQEPDAFQLTEEIQSYLLSNEIPQYMPLIKENPIEEMKELLKINV